MHFRPIENTDWVIWRHFICMEASSSPGAMSALPTMRRTASSSVFCLLVPARHFCCRHHWSIQPFYPSRFYVYWTILHLLMYGRYHALTFMYETGVCILSQTCNQSSTFFTKSNLNYSLTITDCFSWLTQNLNHTLFALTTILPKTTPCKPIFF